MRHEEPGRVEAQRRGLRAASRNATEATKTGGRPRLSSSPLSYTLHDVQEPQSASASTATWQPVPISEASPGGSGVVKVGLQKRATRSPRSVIRPAAEKGIAARLGDIQQAHDQDVERGPAQLTFAPCQRALVSRIEQYMCTHSDA